MRQTNWEQDFSNWGNLFDTVNEAVTHHGIFGANDNAAKVCAHTAATIIAEGLEGKRVSKDLTSQIIQLSLRESQTKAKIHRVKESSPRLVGRLLAESVCKKMNTARRELEDISHLPSLGDAYVPVPNLHPSLVESITKAVTQSLGSISGHYFDAEPVSSLVSAWDIDGSDGSHWLMEVVSRGTLPAKGYEVLLTNPRGLSFVAGGGAVNLGQHPFLNRSNLTEALDKSEYTDQEYFSAESGADDRLEEVSLADMGERWREMSTPTKKDVKIQHKILKKGMKSLRPKDVGVSRREMKKNIKKEAVKRAKMAKKISAAAEVAEKVPGEAKLAGGVLAGALLLRALRRRKRKRRRDNYGRYESIEEAKRRKGQPVYKGLPDDRFSRRTKSVKEKAVLDAMMSAPKTHYPKGPSKKNESLTENMDERLSSNILLPQYHMIDKTPPTRSMPNPAGSTKKSKFAALIKHPQDLIPTASAQAGGVAEEKELTPKHKRGETQPMKLKDLRKALALRRKLTPTYRRGDTQPIKIKDIKKAMGLEEYGDYPYPFDYGAQQMGAYAAKHVRDIEMEPAKKVPGVKVPHELMKRYERSAEKMIDNLEHQKRRKFTLQERKDYKQKFINHMIKMRGLHYEDIDEAEAGELQARTALKAIQDMQVGKKPLRNFRRFHRYTKAALRATSPKGGTTWKGEEDIDEATCPITGKEVPYEGQGGRGLGLGRRRRRMLRIEHLIAEARKCKKRNESALDEKWSAQEFDRKVQKIRDETAARRKAAETWYNVVADTRGWNKLKGKTQKKSPWKSATQSQAVKEDFIDESSRRPGRPKKTRVKRTRRKHKMPHFLSQHRPKGVKAIYRALTRGGKPKAMKKRYGPRWKAVAARIASRQGPRGWQPQGPPYKGPLTHGKYNESLNEDFRSDYRQALQVQQEADIGSKFAKQTQKIAGRDLTPEKEAKIHRKFAKNIEQAKKGQDVREDNVAPEYSGNPNDMHRQGAGPVVSRSMTSAKRGKKGQSAGYMGEFRHDHPLHQVAFQGAPKVNRIEELSPERKMLVSQGLSEQPGVGAVFSDPGVDRGVNVKQRSYKDKYKKVVKTMEAHGINRIPIARLKDRLAPIDDMGTVMAVSGGGSTPERIQKVILPGTPGTVMKGPRKYAKVPVVEGIFSKKKKKKKKGEGDHTINVGGGMKLDIDKLRQAVARQRIYGYNPNMKIIGEAAETQQFRPSHGHMGGYMTTTFEMSKRTGTKEERHRKKADPEAFVYLRKAHYEDAATSRAIKRAMIERFSDHDKASVVKAVNSVMEGVDFRHIFGLKGRKLDEARTNLIQSLIPHVGRMLEGGDGSLDEHAVKREVVSCALRELMEGYGVSKSVAGRALQKVYAGGDIDVRTEEDFNEAVDLLVDTAAVELENAKFEDANVLGKVSSKLMELLQKHGLSPADALGFGTARLLSLGFSPLDIIDLKRNFDWRGTKKPAPGGYENA